MEQMVLATDEPTEITKPSTTEVIRRKSRLSGNDAIRDIPDYLRVKLRPDFLDHVASYPIDTLMEVSLQLDYDELVSSSIYVGKVRPGRSVPAGCIRIGYFTPRTSGNLSNYRSLIGIDYRYPGESEMDDMVSKMSSVCSDWDEEMLDGLDPSVARFLKEDFGESGLTTKDLRPEIERYLTSGLRKLYNRLDAVALSCVERFRSGKRFGYYEVEPM